MIVHVNKERHFYISPGRAWCFLWHNSLWTLGVVQTLYLAFVGALATAGIAMPAWVHAIVLFVGVAVHNLQNYLKANPPPELRAAPTLYPPEPQT
jgi:hypothetical protein